MAVLVATATAVIVPVTAPTAPASPRPAPRATTDRPNIVLVLLDDARTDEMRFLPKTRKLITQHGRTFTQLIAAHPLCCPARATLVTGQYGQNNGVESNKGPWGGNHALRDPDNNIGVWLKRAGYDTAYYGKFLNGYKPSSPRPKGWSVWKPLVAGTYGYTRYRFYGEPWTENRYITHSLRDKWRSGIQSFGADGKPFFMFINQTAPHDAFGKHFGPPKYEPKYAGAYPHLGSLGRRSPAFGRPGGPSYPSDLRKWGFSAEREDTWQRARARALRSADDSIAGLVSDLRAAGQLANTEIIVTSDNGYQMGEHVWAGKNLLFRESLQVPMSIRGPGMTRGSTYRRQVTQADISAQILQWAHARPGRRIDGLPFGRVGARRTTLLIQTGDAVRDSSPGWWYRGVRTSRYTYGRRETGTGGPGGVLFDHKADPWELHNVWGVPRYHRVRQALSRRFVALQSCKGAGCNPLYNPLPTP